MSYHAIYIIPMSTMTHHVILILSLLQSLTETGIEKFCGVYTTYYITIIRSAI